MNNHNALFLMQQIYITIFSLTNKLQVKGDGYYEHLTSRQVMALVAILHLPENETTINNIARILGTTKQSMKRVLSIIENKGYIISVPSQLDKRAVNLKITRSGKQILKNCGENSIRFLADISQNLSIEEMEMLWALLKKLYSFDGEEQNGFEEEVDYKIGEFRNDSKIRTLNEFERLRNKTE
ncbi:MULTISPECIES: MarR family winged helix-turn-helix transcriptional regulator [Clostridium]|uniref:Predicted transcriptional regulator, marR family n=2 Tax=Clostridium TaxID=1485 RepID=D8GUE8_CLOLD|nr:MULTISPECIES: MarR family transcriptional regulator [Clostridium]ADK14811.1 predicted transcriptional regulator, marR family [Clostridium ljungdahlii DSM 13528]AGY78062.1 MarR family transcriptional regulator [Clostridium autoethanogenum DSM 10061]ALU38196.1 Transcriptional regulator MarR family [Clostridium autoethanogenum DSM 10061]OAA86012.1 Transcriptional regulator SlyA [Clostridium ljungdahlii DSM 13528]OVY50960.1 Transcriptional regulator SlyA [Clostridium autoethanogenum]